MRVPAPAIQSSPPQAAASTRASWWSSPLAPVAMFVALSLTDAFVSTVLLGHGLMNEANPLMCLVLTRLGLAGFLGIKLLVTAGAALLLAAHRRTLPRLAWTATALYVMVWTCGFVMTNLGPLSLLSSL